MAISNSVEAMIDNIVTVVFRIHFYYVTNKDLEQDLKQEGYLKAYELLAEGNYDPNKNLRNFIYTGVRNAMTNYLYHNKKETHEDLDLISNMSWQKYESVTLDGYWNHKIYYEINDYPQSYSINLNLINDICNKYTMFGDYKDIILNKLYILGLYPGPKRKTTIKPIDFIEDAILGEILWTMFK